MIRLTTNCKKCDFEGCTTITPVFNYPGTKVGVRCAVHRADGMVNVKSIRLAATLDSAPFIVLR